ncbi:hypothetical protein CAUPRSCDRAFT_10568 [Caulochytrium protostelioides]|uniref:Uncharacterized protein n=1 Tax=Caulochytrium protostelioides TaxID=1555241 RepID=A0A4P9WZE9_9FUNG|nr:hypothetical protein CAUPRSCDRAFT_10568 [Caulochytrium protostelioides]
MTDSSDTNDELREFLADSDSSIGAFLPASSSALDDAAASRMAPRALPSATAGTGADVILQDLRKKRLQRLNQRKSTGAPLSESRSSRDDRALLSDVSDVMATKSAQASGVPSWMVDTDEESSDRDAVPRSEKPKGLEWLRSKNDPMRASTLPARASETRAPAAADVLPSPGFAPQRDPSSPQSASASASGASVDLSLSRHPHQHLHRHPHPNPLRESSLDINRSHDISSGSAPESQDPSHHHIDRDRDRDSQHDARHDSSDTREAETSVTCSPGGIGRVSNASAGPAPGPATAGLRYDSVPPQHVMPVYDDSFASESASSDAEPPKSSDPSGRTSSLFAAPLKDPAGVHLGHGARDEASGTDATSPVRSRLDSGSPERSYDVSSSSSALLSNAPPQAHATLPDGSARVDATHDCSEETRPDVTSPTDLGESSDEPSVDDHIPDPTLDRPFSGRAVDAPVLEASIEPTALHLRSQSDSTDELDDAAEDGHGPAASWLSEADTRSPQPEPVATERASHCSEAGSHSESPPTSHLDVSSHHAELSESSGSHANSMRVESSQAESSQAESSQAESSHVESSSTSHTDDGTDALLDHARQSTIEALRNASSPAATRLSRSLLSNSSKGLPVDRRALSLSSKPPVATQRSSARPLSASRPPLGKDLSVPASPAPDISGTTPVRSVQTGQPPIGATRSLGPTTGCDHLDPEPALVAAADP